MKSFADQDPHGCEKARHHVLVKITDKREQQVEVRGTICVLVDGELPKEEEVNNINGGGEEPKEGEDDKSSASSQEEKEPVDENELKEELKELQGKLILVLVFYFL